MKNRRYIAIAIVAVVVLAAGMGFSAQFPSCAMVLTQMGGTVVIKDKSGAVMAGVSSVGAFEPSEILNQYLGLTDPNIPGKGLDKYKLYNGGSLQNWQLPDGKIATDIQSVTAYGRRGGCVTNPKAPTDISAPLLATLMGTREGMVGGGGIDSEGFMANPDCNEPGLKNTLPVLCPQMASFRYLNGEKGISENVLQPKNDFFDATYNFVNNIPANAPKDFDCTNVLKVDTVTTRYDWEDDALLWGIGFEGKEKGEIKGGDYSRFRYILFPLTNEKKQIYDSYYKTMVDYLNGGPLQLPYQVGKLAIKASELVACADSDLKTAAEIQNPCNADKKKAYQAWQYLVHLGQDEAGKGLSLLGKAKEEPSLKMFNTLPGAFLTTEDDPKKKDCEWLDTKFQAPEQTMVYKNFPVWDWDTDPAVSCVGIVILEGDGGTQKTFGLISGYYNDDFIQDDLVGYFTVCKGSPEATGKMLKNYSDDFEMTLSTGNTICKK